MKKQGHEYQGPLVTDPVPAVELPAVVTAAIMETSGTDQELAYDQMVYAQSLLDGEMEPVAVAQLIRNGAEVEVFE